MKKTKINKSARKILFILLMIVCVAFVAACDSSEKRESHEYGDQWSFDEANHWKTCKNDGCDEKTSEEAHSFGKPVVTEPKDGKDGSRVYTCSVCGKTKTEVIAAPPHEHVAIEEWISNSTMHWHACTGKDCSEKLDSSDHVWDEGTVTKEALSGVEGEMRYVCTVCQNTKNESIPALPEKMSEEEWAEIFVFDNVIVEEKSTIGDTGVSTTVVKIDGEFAELVSEEGSYYSDSESHTLSFDFSLNYNDFNHLGDGTYYAKSLSITDEGIELELSDVTFVVTEGKIRSVTYQMELIGVECKLEYTFSKWGEVSVEVPTLSEEEFRAAIDPANFNNYTMDVCIFDAEGNLSGVTYYFNGNECYYSVYTEDGDYEEFYETVNNAGVEKNEYINILEELSATDFVYDTLSGAYVYTDDNTYVVIGIEEGALFYIEYIDAEGNEHYADLYDYGTTVIE